MPGPDRIIHTDEHHYAHTDAERVTDQGANMDRIPNDILRPVYHAVNAWWCSVYDSDGERDAERDILSACRALLAYVDGEQQRDSDAEPDPERERERDAEPRPEWVTELVAHVRRAADAAERIAERVCYLQPAPEPDLDPEFGVIHRAYRLGWEAGAAAGKHRSQ